EKMTISSSRLSILLGYAALPLIFLIIGFMFFSFPVGAYTFFNTEMGLEIESAEDGVVIPIFVAGLLISILPSKLGMGDVFMILWMIYLTLLVISLLTPKSIFRVIFEIPKRGVSSLLQNTLIATIITFSALLLAIILIEQLQQSVGITTGQLEGIPSVIFFNITLSPIVEEFGFRVTTIGFFAALTLASRGAGISSLKAFWHPGHHLRQILGSKGETPSLRSLYGIAILSGIFFGLAHLLYGSGQWELGKVTTAGLAGVALGIFYIHYGFTGAVLLHWSFNYLVGSFTYFEQSVGELGFVSIMSYLIIVTGVVSTVILLVHTYIVGRGN
ncbi:MAG: CPBP family glutamic-type intramembrane protease, partial [Thaumarchaeota archaeon]|nr:CPBP family glutamic-type intramembrane protease [Nitrososphaerota archaeon]